MMIKIKISISVLAMVFTLTVSQLCAQTELYGQTRISFAKGQTSKTISRIIPESSDDFFEWLFVVHGRGGQTMTVTVRSLTGKVHFTAAGKSEIRQLRETGDHNIAVINDGRKTRFWMTVTIR